MQALNVDPAVDAMLVQYPGPPQVDFDAVLLAVDPDKDVDGMHPTNVGRLALGIPGPVACTPAGIEALLAHYEVPVAGRDVVIVGRGVTIGRPLSILLSQKRPPPTPPSPSCTPASPSGPSTPAGRHPDRRGRRPGMIEPEHIKPGGVVVGAGVQYQGRSCYPTSMRPARRWPAGSRPRFGGVGPTTIALLFRNFVEAAERHASAGTDARALTELPPIEIEGHRSSGTRDG